MSNFFRFTTTIILSAIFCASLQAQRNEIPNGGFENWPDDFAPAGYGSFQAPQRQYDKLRTVFKSNDARSGSFSVRLRNASIKEAVAAMNINTQGVNFPDQIIPSGIWSCEGNCKIPPKGNLSRAKFPVTKRYKTLCGYYKGKLTGGDKLFISVIVFKGNNIMGGSDAGLIQHAFITTSSTGWKKFEIPITYTAQDGIIPDGAAIEISIVGASYPQNPYAGGTGQSVHLGTEVLIDDVEFCTGKADVLVFTPKVMNEVSTSTGSTNADSVTAAGGENQSTGTNVQIPENEHLRPGVQTFVNMDNDDMDKFFDYDPENVRNLDKKIAGGDDELIKIILRIPERIILTAQLAHREMSAKLEATSGRANIMVWKSDTKDTLIPLPKTFRVFEDFTERSGEYLIYEIWVEGIKAHTRQMETVLKFTHSEDLQFKEEFAITIIGIEKIEWIGRENSLKNTNTLDRDPNHRNPSDNTGRGQAPEGECGGRAAAYSLKPEGLRVFPCRRVLNGIVLDDKPRNIVDIKVTLSVKPVKPVKIYFKSFDVDDPTASGINIPPQDNPIYEYWVDNENENDDNRGSAGEGINKHAGKFPDEDVEGIVEIEFDEIEKIFPFEVTMQPGDNFRIVGSCDKDFLRNVMNEDAKLNVGADLDIQNANKQRITDRYMLPSHTDNPKEAEIRFQDKNVSNTLSIWRFLYAEIDYMKPITNGTLHGTIASVVPNSPIAGQSTIYLADNIATALTNQRITNISVDNGTYSKITGNGLTDAYQEGKITVELPGGAISRLSITYDIMHNSGRERGADTVVIKGVIPEQAAGQGYFMKNDDEDMKFKEGYDLKTCIEGRIHLTETRGKCLVANRYQYAYIQPDFTSLNTPTMNAEPSSPFLRNTKKYDGDDNALFENYRFDNERLQSYEDFWVVYILFAFKGTTYEDGDPDGEYEIRNYPATLAEGAISGITDTKRKGAHIFLDGVLERNGGVYYSAPGNGKGELDCITHELAHLLGADHIDAGLLAYPDPTEEWFSPRTLGRIRSSKRPGIPK